MKGLGESGSGSRKDSGSAFLAFRNYRIENQGQFRLLSDDE
jgi:hypothetical protein